MQTHRLFIRWRGRGAVALGVIAAGLTLGLWSGSAGGAGAGPDLVVSALPNPVPEGEPGTYAFGLTATIADRGDAAAPASEMRFYLSADRRLSSNDERLPLLKVHGLRAGAKETVHETWKVPQSLAPGIYHVLACEHNKCAATERTVAVTQPGDGPTELMGASSPGAVQASQSPKPEWFPKLSEGPFDCPISLHGQDGKCVWVNTYQVRRDHELRDDPNRVISVFSYCPAPYSWPYEVAIGFDPMWENKGFKSDAFIETVARQKWTLYTSFIGRQYYPSYGAPNETSGGYISIDFNGEIDRPWSRTPWEHKARYMCADKHANSMLP
jgi:hypothetical protein